MVTIRVNILWGVYRDSDQMGGMELDELAIGAKVALVGALLTAVGAFLTWVDASVVTVSGIDGDGLFTLVFGVAAAAIVLLVGWDRKGSIGTAVLGLLTILIAANVYTNLEEVAALGGDVVSAGGGLHLTLIGGIVLLAAGIQGYRETGGATETSAPAESAS